MKVLQFKVPDEVFAAMDNIALDRNAAERTRRWTPATLAREMVVNVYGKEDGTENEGE